MLFTYTENSIATVLEDVKAGAMEEGEALAALVKDDEILQEVKARNVELLEFLCRDGVVEAMLESLDDVMFEILNAVDVDELTVKVAQRFEWLVEKVTTLEDPAATKWEQLLTMVAHRHRHTLRVTPATFTALLAQLGSKASATAAFHALFAKRPLLLPDLDVSSVLSVFHDGSRAAACWRVVVDLVKLRPIQSSGGWRELADAVTSSRGDEDLLAAQVRVFEAAVGVPDDVVRTALRACADELRERRDARVGEARVAIASFVETTLVERRRTDLVAESGVLAPMLDLFFAFPEHSIFQRRVVDLLCVGVFQQSCPVDLLNSLLPRLEATFLALETHKTSSLRAHVVALAETLANALYRDLLAKHNNNNASSSSSKKEVPSPAGDVFFATATPGENRPRHFDALDARVARNFLVFVAEHLSQTTAKRATPHHTDDFPSDAALHTHDAVPPLLPPSAFVVA